MFRQMRISCRERLRQVTVIPSRRRAGLASMKASSITLAGTALGVSITVLAAYLLLGVSQHAFLP